MTTRPSDLAAVAPTAVPCLRFPGFGTGDYEHPEGVCACFRGGPAPRRRAPAWPAAFVSWLSAEEAALIWGRPAESAVA
jgi:hypothetical protein